MSTTAAEAPVTEAPAKKGGALKLVLAVVIAAAASGGGAFFVMQKKIAAQPAAQAEQHGEDAEGESAASDESGSDTQTPSNGKGAAAADFAALAPQFVVNLNDEEAMRFLQVEVQVIARKASAMEAVKLNDPIVRNRLMMLFSSQTYHALLSREGKEKLQLDALAEINKVLDEHKKPHIDGVVFTNLVMQ